MQFVVLATPNTILMLAGWEKHRRAGVELVQAVDARCRPVVAVRLRQAHEDHLPTHHVTHGVAALCISAMDNSGAQCTVGLAR